MTPWGPEGPPRLWKFVCGTGYSSPVVVRDRLILLHRVGDEELVSCLNADTGAPIWERRYPTAFVCGSHYTSGPYSTPTGDQQRIYTLGAEGQLHAWSAVDGSLVWQRQLRDEFQVPTGIFGMGHSPLLWNNLLIVNVGGTTPDSGIIAFKAESGEVAWRCTADGAAFATPRIARIHDQDYLFVLTRNGLAMLLPHTGALHWSMPFESRIPDSANAVSPLITGDLVMVCAWGVGTKVMRVAADGDVTEVWESKRQLTSQYTPLLAVDECVIGVHAFDNSLRCVDAHTGDVRWRWKSDFANCKNIRIGNHLILFGEYGHLGMLACRTDAAVLECATANGVFGGQSRCYAAPAYCGGRLYVRSEGELLCLRMTPS
jgi:outer membrane protein assembly factor BamB